MENGTAGEVVISKGDRLVASVVILLSMIAGIVGNTLVVIAFSLSRRLRTKTNVFVVNLATADILTCVSLPVVVLVLLLDVDMPAENWLNTLCAFNFAVTQIFIGTIFTTLALIAVNRYILITKSKETYKRIFRRKFIFLFLCMSWLYPTLFVVLPLISGIGRIGYNYKVHTCGVRAEHSGSLLYSAIVSSSLTIPTTMIIYCYGGIYLFLRRRNKQMQGVRPPKKGRGKKEEEMFSKSSGSAGDANNVKRKGSISQKQVDITKSLFYTLLAFFICFAPYTIGGIFNVPCRVELYTGMFLIFNSWVNPVLYGVKHPHFRQVFCSIMSRRWAEIPEPAFRWMTSSSMPSTTAGIRNKEFDSTSRTFSGKKGSELVTTE
ncbi:G-protein coupled receptor moody [Holothuria leucospilota]|uniref:G-protein coupled receptor moody n=1 Tax=Holothuria leucospilota TaxID=206669 RepID=A0A9Q0YKY1_HOLLE|nr:G-protein coupled receptor moody [Holothuria leucospilota]